MGDIMRPIPYDRLLRWTVTEMKKNGSIFGVSKIVRHTGGKALPIFDEKIESPFGPAAGPNTQLAQNIIASYAAGARFFELKTVQKMDGRELAACVPKPCITAGDECYNCEWSTELTVEEAYSEYVKAWFVCHLIAKEFGLGDPDGFVFNMSVGYDLDGIKLKKVDSYIEGMKDASERAIFKECLAASEKAVREGLLENVTEEDVRKIPARVSGSITESTLHGCPPDEIERIATYLITEKHLHTFIKCNPTLLGYEFARKTLDDAGFDYIAFDDHHFLEDLQWKDAVPMFERLMKLCAEKNLEFGVKLTNTFPVDVKRGELPSEEMYMSGRSLFLLTTEAARRITAQFDGKLRISYSGGADYFNIDRIFDAGIWPITMATTILKPGGYQRMSQIAGLFEDINPERFTCVDVDKAEKLAGYARNDSRYQKSVKGMPQRKMEEELPLLDCFTAPCRTNCPIGQDIPAYLHAMEEGRAEDAFRIILERNALPFITGTICPHTCADRCMRSYYEEGVHIREVKLMAAEQAFESVLPTITPAEPKPDKKVAVIGGGPAGLSAASFLSRAGVSVTVFEKRKQAGGVPRYAIPGFRIADEAIDRDIRLATARGASLVCGREIGSAAELFEEGFTDIVIATGAWEEGRKALKYGEAMDALSFLLSVKEDAGAFAAAHKTGNIAVIGGGNTAMDVARAAKRLPGNEKVMLVYRRDKRNMPADEEELRMALDDGVEFLELLAPEGAKDGVLRCEVMKLGDVDASGRRAPVSTGEFREIPADLVIAAVGEQVDGKFYREVGAKLDEKGRPVVDEHMMTTVQGVYAAGDARRGPATVVKAIADAMKIAEGIAGAEFDRCQALNASGDVCGYKEKKGSIVREMPEGTDTRCLGCAAVCEVCTDVCPNRANVAVKVRGLDREQILHIDGMCNECGNCGVFCPYSGRPYKDKFTLFWTAEDFEDSENSGFLPLADGRVRMRLSGNTAEYDLDDAGNGLYEPLRLLMKTVLSDYDYLVNMEN